MDGIVYGEGIRPGGVATVHIAIFNRRAISDLQEKLMGIARWAFATFQLSGLNAWIPAHNTLAIRLLTRLGWHIDGIIRRLMSFNGVPTDAVVFSLLREEV